MKTHIFKVVLLGNSGVGKTTLFRKLKGQDGELEKSITDSIDLAPCTLEFMISETVKVQLEVNDTGSIEKFRGSIPTNYFRFCHGIILMYDMTNLASLYDLEEWISDAHQKTAEDPAITYIMIGNKADVVDLDTSNNEGKMFGARHGVVEELQFRISAEKENSGSLHDILKTVAQKIFAAQVTEESVDKEPQIVLTMSSKNSPAENRKSQCTKC